MRECVEEVFRGGRLGLHGVSSIQPSALSLTLKLVESDKDTYTLVAIGTAFISCLLQIENGPFICKISAIDV